MAEDIKDTLGPQTEHMNTIFVARSALESKVVCSARVSFLWSQTCKHMNVNVLILEDAVAAVFYTDL